MSYNDYYNIDDILAEEERILCTFKTDGFRLGHLDSGSDDVDIKKGTNIELSYWLVRSLNENRYVDIVEPVAYQEEFRNKLAADSKVISMRKFPYYDRYGTKIALFINVLILTILRFKDNVLCSTLFQSFKERFFQIFKQSLHQRNADISRIKNDLTSTENIIFTLGYVASMEYESWKNRRGDKIISTNLKYSTASNNQSMIATTQKDNDSMVLKKRKRLGDNTNQNDD
ncbi:GINS complex subunit 3 [Cavenderia fasciculata]|uniref:GINS complex subunit 3 n=1 Tax=Cavenderia fasciculata TaxID=261658 RepID=F4PY89_CACFS|nr:GINS complex subunit 3 [Cavenderia fasciculata]EGG19356.1 GINS complex subunit 3 [Cavenderia fasciculata]|eukprot:XP_004357627.1 GINS complex subunit 3 [Cavenderia fasciculata]